MKLWSTVAGMEVSVKEARRLEKCLFFREITSSFSFLESGYWKALRKKTATAVRFHREKMLYMTFGDRYGKIQRSCSTLNADREATNGGPSRR